MNQSELSAQNLPLASSKRATLAALLERLFPSDEASPGATEIGAFDYVIAALEGPYSGLRGVYHDGLAALESSALSMYKQRFIDLPAQDQDALVDLLERKRLPGLAATEAGEFFEIWQHLREGLFCDPVHGGNRDMLGWLLIGFPGAQYGYSAAEQQINAHIARAPRSVASARYDCVSRRSGDS